MFCITVQKDNKAQPQQQIITVAVGDGYHASVIKVHKVKLLVHKVSCLILHGMYHKCACAFT